MGQTYSYGQMAQRHREAGKERVERAVETIRKTVKLHGPRLVQEEIAGLAPRMPVDRGTYRRSNHFEDIPGGATMYNSAPHAAIIEFGRRPGQKAPPISVIASWVLRKGLVAKGKGGAAEARGVAFLIARAIKRRGLPARHVFALAARRLDVVIRAALAEEDRIP